MDTEPIPIPIRPTPKGFSVNFDTIYPSERCKFVFLDKKSISEITNSSIIDDVKGSTTVNIEYKALNN